MKRYALLFLVFAGCLFAQDYKYAWITDVHIGSPNSETDLDSVVSLINYYSDLKFTIVSGDITEKGKDLEMQTLKNFLDKLKKPYYIVPGNHDTKWSDSGTLKFKEFWKDDKFYFEFDNSAFIGLNTGILMRGGGGHFTPEDIIWLEKKIKSIPVNKEIYFVIHHPLNNEIDNWYKVNNILCNYNVKLILCGHEHAAKSMDFNGIPGVMGRSTLSQGKSWGFNVVENAKDSLFFYTVGKDSLFKRWSGIEKKNLLTVAKIDSLDFVNYSADIIVTKDLNATVSVPPLVWENNIIISQFNGLISCFDSTGNFIWKYDLFGNIISKPAITENTLVAANLSGELFTIDPKNGHSLLSIGFNQPITSQLIAIDYNGSYDKLMFPKETNSKKAVIIGTSTGNLFCYDLESLQELWANKDAKGMIETTPLCYANKLIYGSWDSYVYCLDSRSGMLIWKAVPNKNFYYSTAVTPPLTDGKNVFVTSPDKNLYSIDINLGKINKSVKCDAWESFGLSNDNKKLYVKGMQDIFYTFSADKLNKIKEYNFKYGLDTMPCTPLEWNGNVIFGSKNGNVYLIDKNNKMKTLFFMGSSRILSLQQIKDNKFVAVNMDGKFVIFNVNQE